jgi:serine/threonine-protein kinase
VANFGIVTNPLHNLLAVSKLSGTAPVYAAPELAAKGAAPTARSDIYSLGATLYHMLTGKPPVEGASPVQTLMRLAQDQIKPPSAVLPGLSADIDKVLTTMLALEPGERHSDMQAVLQDLTALGAASLPVPKTARAKAAEEEEPMPEEALDPEAAEAASASRRRALVGTALIAGVAVLMAALALVLALTAPGIPRMPAVNELPKPAPDAPVVKEGGAKPRPPAQPRPETPRRPIGG